jgi:MoaA/NifB/PqqE/SkfB family radical SAM enzyme
MSERMPRCLYLEITDKCNMACPMCVTRNYREQSDGSLLTRDEIRDRLLQPLRALGGQHFVVSGGEPMLSPILLEVLSDAVTLGYNVTFASNVLSESLHRFHDIFMLLNDARHGFQFSFDSIREEEMNTIRGGDVYRRVIDNVRKITALRKRHNYKTRLFAQTVLQEKNAASVFETIEFLVNDVGVDGCEIQPELTYSDVTIDNYRTQKHICRDEDLRAQFLAVARKLFAMASSDSRLLVQGDSYANWERFYSNPARIPGPCNSRNMVMVGAYGDFRGCLFSPTVGNIREINLGDYLKSEPYQKFLQLAGVCRICINGCS